jgi:hypothetical protein
MTPNIKRLSQDRCYGSWGACEAIALSLVVSSIKKVLEAELEHPFLSTFRVETEIVRRLACRTIRLDLSASSEPEIRIG